MNDDTNVHNWQELLQRYPTAPADVQAVPEPAWDDLSGDVKHLVPKGVERAVYRYLKGQSKALHYDAHLENIAFTEPEVQTLIEGGSLAGKQAGEVAQVQAMIRASNYMLARVLREKFNPVSASRMISTCSSRLRFQSPQWRLGVTRASDILAHGSGSGGAWSFGHWMLG